MSQRCPIIVVGTGLWVQELLEPLSRLEASGLAREYRAESRGWKDGTVAFVTATEFVEFDAGEGPIRWTGAEHGPLVVPLSTSATSALLAFAVEAEGDLLADLGIAGYRVSRFDFKAAPRRIDVDPALAAKLTLD